MLQIIGILLFVSGIKCGLAVKQQPIWNSTWTDRLKRDLLLNYDKFSRPSHYENVTNVDVKLTVLHVDINEAKSILTVQGWVKFSWNDAKLIWNPADYGNLETLHIADHEIWQPDVVLYNSATGSSIDHYGHTNCIVYNNGKVLWVPPCQFQAYCNVNVRNWPYDTQKCTLVIGSWTYSGMQIDLKVEKPEIMLLVENPEWNISDLSTVRNVKFYECCTEPYTSIQHNFTLQRRSEMHKTVAITPLMIVILSTLASFWLPSQSGEKIILNCVNALILVIFIRYFVNILPPMATESPLIVCFYCTTLYLVCISLILAVIVISISRNQSRKGQIPRVCKTIIDSWYGSMLGLKYASNAHQQKQPRAEELKDTPFEDNVTNEDQQMINSTTSKPSAQNEFYWALLGTCIDRSAFLLYFIIFVILACRYMV